MCREYHRLICFWDLVELVHKNGAFGPQLIHHESVVDDLVPHVDRRTVLLECQLDDANGPVDTRAEPARRGTQDG